MVKAIMHGCNGHMGRVITDIIKNTEGIELVAGVDKYTKVPNDYPVFESIGACDVEADVIIDLPKLKTHVMTGCTAAVLKANSPSCGHGTIYDGTFSGKKIPGSGVAAELLEQNGIAVYTDEDCAAALPF